MQLYTIFQTSVTGIFGEIDTSNDKFIEIFAQRFHYFEDPFYKFFALNLLFQDTSYSLQKNQIFIILAVLRRNV